jgi:tetratricopeptide (TPR) repeat protein
MICCWTLIVCLSTSGVSLAGQLATPDYYRQAAELFQAGNYKEAEVRLQAALHGQPEFPEAYYLLGRIFAATDRPQEAEASLKRALALRPGFVQARQFLGMLYCERKEYVAARDILAKVSELSPQNSLAHFYLGKSLEGLDDNLGAMSAYQRALESSDKYSEIHSQAQDNLGLLHLKLASSYSEANRLKESIHHLEQAKELLAPSQEFLNLLGAAYLKADDPRAVMTLRQAAELNPTDENWEKLAKTLAAHHKFAEAVDLFEAKVKERPQSESFHMLLGAAYWDKAEYFKALEHYQQAKALNPKSAKAHYLIGSAHLEMGNPSEGQGFLEEAVKLDANLAPANLALASTLMARGRNQEALRFLEKAAWQKAEDADIQVKLGQLYLDLKRYDAALNALTAAERLAPNNKNVHYLLGRLYAETKQGELAQKEFTTFKNLEAAETENKLAK